MSQWSRRQVLASSAALVGGWLVLDTPAWAQPAQPGGGGSAAGGPDGPYQLPPLPYGYADLEPHLDAETLTLHHDRHHAAYVRGANEAIAELAEIRRVGGARIQDVRAVTDALAFNAAGHLLHCLFWENMKKGGGGDPPAESDIARLLARDFGSLEAFRGHFYAAAQQVQGSGWAILAYDPRAQHLLVLQAEKHQNGTAWGCVPLLVLDVWEHAYYLRYHNRRADYIKAFAELIDWQRVQERLARALQLA